MSFPDSIVLSYEQAFSTSATKQLPLGTRGTLPDGRVFRYSKNGATELKPGNPCIGVDPTFCSMLNTSANGQIPAGTTYYTTQADGVLPIGGSWGGTTGGFSADDFADGWLLVGSTVGSGTNNIQQLRIKTHTAYAGGTSLIGDSYCQVTLEDGEHPKWNITTSAGVAMVKNPYNGVIIATTIAALANGFLGVPPVAVAASYYFWLQTWGDCACRVMGAASSALALGSRMIQTITAASTGLTIYNSSNNAGRGQESIGILRSLASSGSYAIVDLRISP